MFLGGAGLADTMLYCRDKIYPLGLPNGLAHVITAIALPDKVVLRVKASFLPPDPSRSASRCREPGDAPGRFSLLAVTTLESCSVERLGRGARRRSSCSRSRSGRCRCSRGFARACGRLGRSNVRGVHFEEADEITIEGDSSRVILDGETFRAESGGRST